VGVREEYYDAVLIRQHTPLAIFSTNVVDSSRIFRYVPEATLRTTKGQRVRIGAVDIVCPITLPMTPSQRRGPIARQQTGDGAVQSHPRER
jgi:hypothetical protein